MTDTEIRINQHIYRIVVYPCTATGGYRAEAGYQGRVVEVVDTTSEATAWAGIRKRLVERRNSVRISLGIG